MNPLIDYSIKVLRHNRKALELELRIVEGDIRELGDSPFLCEYKKELKKVLTGGGQ